ncbi:MAG: DUF4199 domain-containing protein [Rikenellaceae bacterium]
MEKDIIKNIRNKESAKGGLVLGLMFYLTILIEYLGVESDLATQILNFASIIAYVLVIQFYTKRYAMIRGARGTSFATAYGFILLTAAFAGVIYGCLYYIQTNLIDPGYYQQLQRQMIIDNPNLSNELKDEAIKVLESGDLGPVTVILSSVISTVFTCAFFGLVVAVFAKRAPDEPIDTTFQNDNVE